MKSKKDSEQIRRELEQLGRELSKIQFDFKIKNKTSEKYWDKRIYEFEKYHTKTIQYFTQAFYLISLESEEESGVFLLRISKLKQLGNKLLERMKKIQSNTSCMNIKDKQQSKWSIELRDKFIEANNECLDQEKQMNVFFKKFYEKYL